MSESIDAAAQGFLSLSGISKDFGGNTVVRGLDLAVREGEFVSLLGPSGCGKTTTLQMIAGFEPPTAGRIVLAGKDITDLPANRRRIGVVFQNYALFPHMTVAQNITFGLGLLGLSPADQRSRLASLLERVDLGGLQERYPRELSGGQQQRVALARALAVEPRVLLLDEPFSNLDARLRGGLQAEVKRLQRDTGITTILVTHDQSEAMALSDRVAIMSAGSILQVDAPQKAYDEPVSAYVGNFLGNTNLLELPVTVADDGACSVRILARDHRVPGPRDAAAGSLCISLRPERIRLHPGPGDVRIEATIDARAFHGHAWTFEATSAIGGLKVSAAHLGADVPVEGERVWLCWDVGDMRAVHVD